MPAFASLEDLRAAQKEAVSIYAMLYALCSMRVIVTPNALRFTPYGKKGGHQSN